MIGQSALHTKQHYALDVMGGFLIAAVAYFTLLRRPRGVSVTEFDRCVAPYVALMFVGAYALTLAGFWLAYRLRNHG